MKLRSQGLSKKCSAPCFIPLYFAFSETDRAKKLQRLGAGAYIRKPFLLEKIGIAVKEELAK